MGCDDGSKAERFGARVVEYRLVTGWNTFGLSEPIQHGASVGCGDRDAVEHPGRAYGFYMECSLVAGRVTIGIGER
ncbi:MAG: hypothetical protein Kow0077_22550 [Anaerolineae bacterium]